MACLIIVSSLAQILLRSRLGLVRLANRLSYARFGQVGDQVSQVKDQVGQGQGQELDNNPERGYKRLGYFVIPKYIQTFNHLID